VRIAALLALALAACSRPPPPPGIGKRLVAGAVQALRPSADGSWLAYLDGCVPMAGRGLPAGALRCDLSVVPAAGGGAERVARGVSALPGGFAWSPEGHVLAALEEFDAASSAGTLLAWSPGGAPRRLGDGVGFFAFAPRGRLLGYAWRGQLHLWRPGTEGEPVAGATAIASFELHPAGEAGVPLLLARRALAAGGDLLAVTPGRPPVRLGGPAGDYGFAPAGDRIAFTEREGDGYDLHVVPSSAPGRKGEALGRGVTTFAFSRDGGAVAFVAGVAPGRQGELWVARGQGAPERLAAAVGEVRWARGADRLAWLERYDPRVRAGALAVGAPGQKPRTLAPNVSAFELSPDGRSVAFLEHVTTGGYSVDLKVAGESAAPETVARGVFGFDHGPDGKTLWYRAGCVRNAEACDLYALAPGAGEKPRKIADGVKSFEFDRRAEGRLLLGWSRQDRVALDLAVWQGGKRVAIDESALPGSAFFLAPDSTRVAYVVNDPKRAGVYVAEVPR